MGMSFSYIRVSRSNAAKLLERPERIHGFLDGTGADPPEDIGFWRKIFGEREADSPRASVVLEPRPEGDEGDVDKAWHAIHYLLTGSPEGGEFPEAFIVQGGTLVGNEDVGFGPARLLDPTQTARIDERLQQESADSLRSRYDPEAMDAGNVYPEMWLRGGEEGFTYIWDNFAAMREFVRETAARKEGLLVFLC